ILTPRSGGDMANPTIAQLSEGIAEVYHETLSRMTQVDRAKHGAAFLRYFSRDGSMYVLEVNRLREVTFEEWADQDHERWFTPRWKRRGFPEDQALRLWTWLADGHLDRVRWQPWK